MTSEVQQLNTAANAIRSAGEAIGLTVKFKAVSAQNFINFFTDPKARVGIDGFPTVNYPDYADPAALLQHDRRCRTAARTTTRTTTPRSRRR